MALWTVYKPKLISISFAKEATTTTATSHAQLVKTTFGFRADCCFYFANERTNEPTTRLENLIFCLPLNRDLRTWRGGGKMRFPLKFPRAVVSLVHSSSSTFGRMLCSNCMTNSSCQLSHTFRPLSLPATSLAGPLCHAGHNCHTHTHTHTSKFHRQEIVRLCCDKSYVRRTKWSAKKLIWDQFLLNDILKVNFKSSKKFSTIHVLSTYIILNYFRCHSRLIH